MKKEVEAIIRFDVAENDDGNEIECTYAECSKCGLESFSFGTHEGSIKRCLAILNEECPNKEDNFYVEQ